MSTLVRSVRWFAVLALATFSLVGCATTDAELADDEESAEQVDEATLSRSAKLETFRGVDGRYYFYLLAGNGQKVLRSQGYSREADARTGMLAVRNNGTTRAHYVILASRNGEYYFNLKAANGEIIATSETYVTRTNASRAVTTTIRVINLLPADPIATPAPTRAGFQIFTGEDGKRYFRLRAGNGEIVLQSEA